MVEALFQGIYTIFIGLVIGKIIARETKTELPGIQTYLLFGCILSFIVALAGLIFRSDFILFSGLFVLALMSQSLLRGRKSKKSPKE